MIWETSENADLFQGNKGTGIPYEGFKDVDGEKEATEWLEGWPSLVGN